MQFNVFTLHQKILDILSYMRLEDYITFDEHEKLIEALTKLLTNTENGQRLLDWSIDWTVDDIDLMLYTIAENVYGITPNPSISIAQKLTNRKYQQMIYKLHEAATNQINFSRSYSWEDLEKLLELILVVYSKEDIEEMVGNSATITPGS